MKSDTIVAIATGLSNSSISIIRVSGEQAVFVVDKIFKTKSGNRVLPKMESHTVRYGYIYDNDTIVDEVMVLLMKGPKSYTREDTIEINCHGGIVVTKRILELVLRYGARIAEPGEFTKRAFLNGRIDLSRAEAVIDIIQAKNELALKNSIEQLKGTIYNKIKDLRENILRDVAFIEAALDDPEHISLDGFSEELLQHTINQKKEINQLIRGAENGRILKEGIYTVILGKPNAGKSSLMNILVGTERAIVTEIAGTTRDTLEEIIQLDGLCLNLIDTAGIRNTQDVIERIGVEKAKKVAQDADLILYMVDGSTALDENDFEIIEYIKEKRAIVLLNKSDLNQVVTIDRLNQLTNKKIISISAKEHVGIELIKKEIYEMFFKGELNFNDEIYITNMRQKEALILAEKSLCRLEDSIYARMPEDFYSIDLIACYEALGTIIGESIDEDLINMIFREFCMGK